MSAVKSVPEGYPSLSPYLIVRDGAAAIEFYQKVFGATLRMKLDAPDDAVTFLKRALSLTERAAPS